MPELPDITLYVENIEKLLLHKKLKKLLIKSPFLLRTYQPSIYELENKEIKFVQRIDKQIILEFEKKLYLVFHLMIAGRLHWKAPDIKIPQKNGLAAFYFDDGTLILTEAGTKKRASLHLVEGLESLDEFRKGGLDIYNCSFNEFKQRLTAENHTLKRVLTDQRNFSGIGNSYSDEILHHAKLSPVLQSQKMKDNEIESLFISCKEVLLRWTELLRKKAKGNFPEKVTAFHKEMAVHGKFGKNCPDCNTIVQRIRYADNETNYCPGCQTKGKLLADRAMSRILKKDYPRKLGD